LWGNDHPPNFNPAPLKSAVTLYTFPALTIPSVYFIREMDMGRKPARRNRAEIITPDSAPASLIDPGLLGDIRSLIDTSRRQVAQFVNSAMVVTYWCVGTGSGAT
jgi:hypothetical protein